MSATWTGTLGKYSFLRLNLDASQYIPLFNRTRMIASRSFFIDYHRRQPAVPFYLQPALGGPDTLRGYRFNSFCGDNSTMVNAEYRWDASPVLQMVAFADGGKVFNRWEQWNFHDYPDRRGIRAADQGSVQGRFQFRHRLQPRGVSNMVSHEQRNVVTRIDSCRELSRLAFSPCLRVRPASKETPKKFYPDDPLLREPAPRPVKEVAKRDVDDLYDFF